MLSSEFLQSVLTDQAVGSKENKAAGNMALSCTFLKMQVMLSRKSFSLPSALHIASTGTMEEAAEVIPGKCLKFGNEKWRFSPASRLGFWECMWPKGNLAQLWEMIRLAPVLASRCPGSPERGPCGLCAKIPSAEYSVMSERVPIGWKGVDKQEQICIQWCALCLSSQSLLPDSGLAGLASLSWAGSGAGGSLQH